MFYLKRYIISLLLIVLTLNLPAQNITGTWEGDLGNDQFLQLNIIQNRDNICGYSWDYVKADQSSYCKAYFEGKYNTKKGKWELGGTSFIENSGGHMLMRMSLGFHIFKGESILEGISSIKSRLLSLLTGGLDTDYVYITKVADRPAQVLENMKDCFEEEQKLKDTIPIIITPAQPSDSLKITKPDITLNQDSLTISKELIRRKNTEQSHIEVHVKTINLKVYDNAIVDGDTVSIFYNGRLLLSHQRLSEKPIDLNIELDQNQTRQEITLFAENLGSIPPNTALVVVTAGEKRYELFASASLDENAVLVFDYRPK